MSGVHEKASYFSNQLFALATSLMREPLTYFMLIAGGLFAAQWLSGSGADDVDNKIVLPESWVQEYIDNYERNSQHPPSDKDIQAFRENVAVEEVIYRKALSLGLDRKDPVIRRRLVNKMQIIMADVESISEPTETELRGLLAANPDKYQTPEKYSLDVVFLNQANREQASERVQKLNSNQQSVLENYFHRGYEEVHSGALVPVFGRQFVLSLTENSTASHWQVAASDRGYLAYRINQFWESAPMSFDAARPQLLMDWKKKAHATQAEAQLALLMREYAIEWQELSL